MSHPAAHLPPSRALAHLGQISAAYAKMADDYGPVATAAAQAEAEHKAAKARLMLSTKAERERCSVAEAETVADADETISALYLARLTTRALADSHLEKLRQLRTQVEVGRSMAASERAADQFTADRHP